MAYLYDNKLGDDTALVPTSTPNTLTTLLKQLAPIIALVLIGLLVYWVATKSGWFKKHRSNARRARSRGVSRSDTMGGWSKRQAPETRQRILRKLVDEEGYARVVRRLTLLKNLAQERSTTAVVNADLDYLAMARGE